MPKSKTVTISRLRREADAAENRGKQLATNALFTADARRRGRMTLDAASLLIEAETLRNHAAQLEKDAQLGQSDPAQQWFPGKSQPTE